MKPTVLSRAGAVATLLIAVVLLSSWQKHYDSAADQPKLSSPFVNHSLVGDTVPDGNGSRNTGKVRNIDEAIAELDKVDLDKAIADAMKSVEKTMKDFQDGKFQQQMNDAMKQANAAMKEVDVAQLKAEVERSIARIDWDKIQASLDEVKQIDFSKMNLEMQQVQKELEKIGPKMEEEMKKAKLEIGKAKQEMQEYKSFIDGLAQDGLIDKDEAYEIHWKNGSLEINGKKAADSVVRKYESFLGKHKKFDVEKDPEDFNIHVD